MEWVVIGGRELKWSQRSLLAPSKMEMLITLVLDLTGDNPGRRA